VTRSHAALILLWIFGITLANAADSAKSSSDAYLDELQGTWLMEGNVRGKPVRYLAEGQRVLQGGFLKLHVMNSESKSAYEADVFIGFDAKANDYSVHWLDRFGAAGARVVARGERQDQRLVVMFPYAEGAFRDTFTWQPESKSWTLLLESKKDDAWSTFANYTLVLRARH
jgi:hypothetical protein